MHGLQEIIRLNSKAQAKVDAIITHTNLSAKIRANRDRKADRQRKDKCQQP